MEKKTKILYFISLGLVVLFIAAYFLPYQYVEDIFKFCKDCPSVVVPAYYTGSFMAIFGGPIKENALDYSLTLDASFDPWILVSFIIEIVTIFGMILLPTHEKKRAFIAGIITGVLSIAAIVFLLVGIIPVMVENQGTHFIAYVVQAPIIIAIGALSVLIGIQRKKSE